jgi:hypothetical protein
MKTKPSPGFITFAVVGLTALIFILDLFTPLGIAAWLLYLIPLLLAGIALPPRRAWPLAGICAALTVAGFFLSPAGVTPSLAALNRTVCVATFAVTVWLVTRHKRTEAELRRTNRALRTISECNQLLVRTTDEQTLLDGVCRLLVEHGGYRMCWVGFAEQDEARSVPPRRAGRFRGGLS